MLACVEIVGGCCLCLPGSVHSRSILSKSICGRFYFDFLLVYPFFYTSCFCFRFPSFPLFFHGPPCFRNHPVLFHSSSISFHPSHTTPHHLSTLPLYPPLLHQSILLPLLCHTIHPFFHHSTPLFAPRHSTPHHTRPHHTTLHHTRPHHTAPHHTRPHHTTLHHTRPHHSTPHLFTRSCNCTYSRASLTTSGALTPRPL